MEGEGKEGKRVVCLMYYHCMWQDATMQRLCCPTVCATRQQPVLVAALEAINAHGSWLKAHSHGPLAWPAEACLTETCWCDAMQEHVRRTRSWPGAPCPTPQRPARPPIPAPLRAVPALRETEPVHCWCCLGRSVNVPTRLLECLQRQQAKHGVTACLIHISTDQVWHGPGVAWHGPGAARTRCGIWRVPVGRLRPSHACQNGMDRRSRTARWAPNGHPVGTKRTHAHAFGAHPWNPPWVSVRAAGMLIPGCLETRACKCEAWAAQTCTALCLEIRFLGL